MCRLHFESCCVFNTVCSLTVKINHSQTIDMIYSQLQTTCFISNTKFNLKSTSYLRDMEIYSRNPQYLAYFLFVLYLKNNTNIIDWLREQWATVVKSRMLSLTNGTTWKFRLVGHMLSQFKNKRFFNFFWMSKNKFVQTCQKVISKRLVLSPSKWVDSFTEWSEQ